jgi:flagellar basal-body rod protein FlgB
MDIGQIPLFSALSKRMSWLTARQTVLAENVANANTPGYIAKDIKEIDFKSLLGKTSGAHGGPLQMAADQVGHIALGAGNNQPQIVQLTDDKSLDGNGVSLEEQMMKVSTNAADYSLITTLYKQNVSMIKSVLGGGGG